MKGTNQEKPEKREADQYTRCHGQPNAPQERVKRLDPICGTGECTNTATPNGQRG